MDDSFFDDEEDQKEDGDQKRKKKKNCCKKGKFLTKWSDKTEWLVEHDKFSSMIITFIIINTVFLALEHDEMPSWMEKTSDIANLVLTAVFTLEMCLKLFGLGIKGYIHDRFNVFDCIIVLVSLVELT